MQTLAIGLVNHNPLAYLFFIILLEPPVMIILLAVIDKIKECKQKKKTNTKKVSNKA